MGRNSRQRLTVPAHRKSGALPSFAPLSFRYRNTRTALLTCTALCAIVTVAVTPLPAVALPQNGQVVSGTAQIVVKANEIDVIQSSSKVVINWSSFNIAAGEKVLFLQGSAAAQALNQILGGGSSQIMGQLQSNGMVIISNPNGILIGQGADVRVGAIIATTASMSAQAQAAFLAGGKASFDIASASATASVVNRGSITAGQAGLVGLVAPGVENSGFIQARLGTVQLAAGNTFTVDLYGDKLIKLAPGDKVMSQVTAIDGSPLTALVSNSGTISADGGTIILTANAAKTIVTNIINMDGIAQARSVGTSNGVIVLDGGETGVVHVAGTLDASGREAGQTGGTVKVLGDKVGLFDGARIDVAGDAGGGAVAVGGNFHGAGPDRNASFTYVASSAVISADALTTGNGGQVAVWADGTTHFNGTISAKGSALGGDGGFVETSGKQHLSVGDAAKVDLGASKGKTGTWLLDPTDITITSSDSGSGTWDGGVSMNSFTTGGSDSISTTTLVTNLGTADVAIIATNDIVISSAINSSANTDAHALAFYASTGKIKIGANVTTKGNQTYSGAVVLTGAIGTVQTLDSSAGDGNVNFTSTVNAAQGLFQGLVVNAGAGNIAFGSTIGGSSGLLNLAVTGSHITLGGNVSTGTPGGRYTAGDGNQTYTGAVILGASTTLDVGGPGNLSFSSTVDATTAGVESLTVSQGSNSTFGGSVGGNTSLASLEVNVTNDITLGGNATTSGNQRYSGNGHVYLTSDVTLDSSASNGNVYFYGTVSSLATTKRALTIAAGTGNVTFSNPVGDAWMAFRSMLTSLSVTGGDITLSRYVKTSGNQTYNGHVIVGNNGEDLDSSAGNGNLYFASVDGATASTNPLSLKAGTGNITIGGTVGANTRMSWVAMTGSNINLGGDVNTGWAQTYTGKVILTNDSTMNSTPNNGSVTFTSTVDAAVVGGQGLTVTTGTGNISFGGAVGGTARLANLSLSGGNIRLGVNVTTTGDQTYTGATILTGNVILTSSAGNGNVLFSSTLDSDNSARTLTIAAGTGNVGFGDVVGGSNALSSLTVTGSNLSLGGNVTTFGNQTYTGKVILGASSTLDSSASNGNIAFSSTVNSDGTARALTIAAGTGNVGFGDTVGGGNMLASMAVTGSAITLGGNVTTNANQTYTGAVLLSGSDILTSSGNVSFSSSVDAGSVFNQGLTVTTSANVAFGGAVGVTAPLAYLTVSAANIALGGDVKTAGNQTYTGSVVLNANDTLTSSLGGSTGNVSFGSTVNAATAGTQSLTLAAGTGNVAFGGAVGATNRLASLAVTGSKVTIGGNVTTSGNQAYSGGVVLSASDTLDSSNGNGNVSFSSAIEATTSGGQGLTVNAGTGKVTFGAAEGLNASLSTLAVTGSTISLNGNVTTTGNQTYTGAVVLPIGSRMRSGAGNVAFSSTVDAGTSAGTQTLTVFGTGNVSFGGAVGATNKFASLIATETHITLGGNVTTGGSQNYNGAVTLGADSTLDSSASNGNIGFSSTVDSDGTARALTIAAGTGNVGFGGAVGGSNRLASTAVSGGNVTLGGNVSTVNDQNWQGNIILGSTATLSMSGSGFMTFQQTVDAASAGTQGLTVDAAASSGVFFKRNVGGTAALASLTSTTGTTVSVLYDVTTTGNQTYNGPFSLRVGNTHTLSSAGGNGNMLFGSTVDALTAGTQALTLAAGTGNVTFGGAVGGTNRLASLAVTGGKVTLGGNVTTSGNQTYTGPVVLSASDTLDSSGSNGNVSFTSTVDGTTASQQGLTVTSGTGSVTFGGIVGGIKALLSRTVNGASLSKGSGGIAVAPAANTGTGTGTTASTSQTTNAVVNTVSTIVGGTTSASSGSTSQSPSASSSGVSTRVAFAPDVFAKEYKLVTVSPALAQQNPSANQAGSSLFGGTGTGGNTVTASSGGPGGNSGTGGTGASTTNAPAPTSDSGATATNAPTTGTSPSATNAPAGGAKPATSAAPATGAKPATTTAPATGTSANNGAPAPAVASGAAPSRPVTAAQARAQAKAEARAQAKAQAKAIAVAKAKAKAEAKAEAKAQAQAKAKALAEARAEARAQARAQAR